MLESKKKFQTHPVHETLNGLLNVLHENADTSNKRSSSNVAKLYKILIKTRIIVQSIDPDFYPISELDKINDLLTGESFNLQIAAAINNRDGFDYNLAGSTLENLAESVYKLSGMSDKSDEIELLKKIESNFTQRYNKNEKEIIDLKLTLEYELKEAKEHLNEIYVLEKTLRERADQTKNVIANNENMMLTEQKHRMDEFAKEQASRQDSFKRKTDEALDTITYSARQAYENQEEIIKDKTAQLLEKISNSEKDISEKHQSIKDIHELVAEDGIAGSYKKNADDEKKATNLWRWITMGCYALIILWVLFKNKLGFETYIDNEIQWPVLAITLSITAISFIAAQFSSKQSRLHLINEQKMRWFALEVKAIDPFISSLPENERNDLKKQLSEKLFCQQKSEDFSSESESQNKSLDALSSVVNNLSDTIKSLTKK